MMASELGCTSILVASGKGGSDALYDVEPDHRATELLEAARIIAGRDF
jgi:hypothetical protein